MRYIYYSPGKKGCQGREKSGREAATIVKFSGSILLFHGRQKDIRCLEQLIPWLLAEGYECVTVSTLLGLEPVATSTDLYVYGR